MTNSKIEKPVVGYIVIACSLLAGMVAANAFGQTGSRVSNPASLKQSSVAVQAATPPATTRRLVPHRRWILGVRADATGTGYLIRSVEQNSAASRIGLEPGDRIVAVDGQQIGFVGAQCVLLARTLEQMGGRDGRVQLLVQDRRNRRLVSMGTTLRAPLHHLGH